MARGIRLPIIGDPDSLLRAFKQSSEAADQFGRHIKKVGTDAQASARLQIEAAARKDARLRSEIAVYRQVAATAKRGSQEQVTAANLAAQAEVRLARSLSVTSKESRALATSASHAQREIGRATRGALAGSGAFRSFGRSLAFASAGFLSTAGIVTGMRSLIREQAVVQEETEKTGVVFGRNAREVQKWAGTLSTSFGVSRAAALQAAGTFGNMLIPLHFGTGAAAAMSKRLVELAADMASFNNASPATVLQALSSGLAGQVRPLRQYGVFLSQARIQEEAWTDGIARRGHALSQQQKVQAAYNIILKDTKNAQGDVARNTESLSVAWSKLTAAVSDTESGNNALLKSTVSLVNGAAKWLGDTRNQEKLQRELSSAVHTSGQIVRGFADAIRVAHKVLAPFVAGLGGARKTAELAGLVFLGLKLKVFSFSRVLDTASTSALALRTRLLALQRIGTIGITLAIATEFLPKPKQKNPLGRIPIAGSIFGAGQATAEAIFGSSSEDLSKVPKDPVQAALRAAQRAAMQGRFLGESATDPGTGRPRIPGAAGSFTLPALTVAQQRAFALARNPDDVAALRAQRDYDTRALAFLKKRFAAGRIDRAKYVEQALALENDRRQQQDRLDSIAADANQKRTDAAKKVAAAARKHAAALVAAQKKAGEIAQYVLKGVGPLGADTAKLSAALAKAQQKAGSIAQYALKGVGQLGIDTTKLAKAFNDAVSGARDSIGALFAGPVLAPTDFQTKARLGVPGPNPGRLVADLRGQVKQFTAFQSNLSRLGRAGAPPELLKELRGRGLDVAPEVAALSTAAPKLQQQFFKAFGSREALATKIGAMTVQAQMVTVKAASIQTPPIVVHVDIDGRPAAAAVTVHQNRAAGRSVVQRRGRNPGFGGQAR